MAFDLEVKEYGTSTVINLPRDVREKTGLKAGDFVRISFQKMKLVPADEEKESPPVRKTPSDLRGRRVVVTGRGSVIHRGVTTGAA